MKQIGNKIYFNLDGEFTDFCIRPYAEIVRNGNSAPSVIGDYSDEYNQCLEQGKVFIIEDEDSEVYKRQCVSKRVPVLMDGVSIGRDTLVQLDVQNLEEFFDY